MTLLLAEEALRRRSASYAAEGFNPCPGAVVAFHVLDDVDPVEEVDVDLSRGRAASDAAGDPAGKDGEGSGREAGDGSAGARGPGVMPLETWASAVRVPRSRTLGHARSQTVAAFARRVAAEAGRPVPAR